MAGNRSKEWERHNEVTAYVVETEEHDNGVTIAVRLPNGLRRVDSDHTYQTEGQALDAADALARQMAR